MKKVFKTLLFSAGLLCSVAVQGQFLPLVTVYDSLMPDIEQKVYGYNFDFPIKSDILSNNPGTPSYTKRYQMSLFGPRYKTTWGTNETTYDFHQGEDFTGDFTYNGVTYTTDANKIAPDSSNLARLVCACKGIVDDVIDGTDADMEKIETGRSVRVKCNEQFNLKNKTADWGNIYIVYRHLSKVWVVNGDSINIGDTVGLMGASGYTSTIHLHFSVQRRTNRFINVHPMRIFNPTTVPYLHAPLQTAYIEHVHSWADSALLRLSVPRPQMSLKQIKVKYKNVVDENFEFETISDNVNRDDFRILPNLSVLAYNFNRASTQYSRYQSTSANMPAFYPASPVRDTALGIFPIENKAPYNDAQIVATFDLIVRNLPAGYSYKDIEVAVSDIYGNTVKTNNPTTAVQEVAPNAAQYNIYPIPANGRLMVDGVRGNVTMEVLNSMGQTVLTETLTNGQNTINIGGLAKGIYYCKFAAAGVVKKIVID